MTRLRAAVIDPPIKPRQRQMTKREMTTAAITLTVDRLTSGECRWIGREDIHVYCHAPLAVTPTYCVVCPDAGLPYDNWVIAVEAVRLIESALATRAAA